ncbi:MAG: chitobiase/beta-hexosaminidase C-terminal domain-containing protein [Candidatus Cloacimonetes bacterium]|nr:chitobiase/beta-hexosaminidase C-terminal domain-containing protein [Candidatus Cloacimonadota bacterium]
MIVRMSDFSVKLTLCITLLLGVACLYAQFSGGRGTGDDPYLVATADDLNNIRNHLSGYFIQTADIDLQGTTYVQGTGWVEIGTFSSTSAIPFTGTYMGNGYKILNLYSTGYTRGLFGFTQYAVLDNINLVNCQNNSGRDQVGGLVGKALNTNISYCHVNGSIAGLNTIGALIGHASNSNISWCSATGSVNSVCDPSGGLIGKSFSSNISDCMADVLVSGSTNVGGFIGACYSNTTIIRCMSKSTVTGFDYVGGFLGIIYHADCSNSFATGNVNATTHAGGFSGKVEGTSRIDNCYSIGFVSGSIKGGLNSAVAGSAYSITNSYWNIDTSGITVSAGGLGRPTEQMVFPYYHNTYQNWNFSIIWHNDIWYDINNGYPYLNIDTSIGTVAPVSFEPRGGFYNAPILVSIYCNTPDSQIYYTLDGTLPIQQSTLYTGPFLINIAEVSPIVLKARSFKAGFLPSQIDSVLYNYGTVSNGEDAESYKAVTCSVAPNPFIQQTEFTIKLSQNGKVNLSIYNAKGQLVRTLADKTFAKGEHKLVWNGQSEQGTPVPCGMYFYRLSGADFRQNGKLIFIK